MSKNALHLHLGASMYVPATQSPSNLVSIGNGLKYPNLRSMIFCTEDAVRENEVHIAINHLTEALPDFNDNDRPLRFVRVRNPYILGRVLAMRGIEKVDGFVLPKVTPRNIREYLAEISNKDNFAIMPTLETKEAFDEQEMAELRRILESEARDRVICLRIGGNDLLHCLRVRRDPTRSIYETPVGGLIARLAGQFIPYGFGLSAPVFESMEHPEVLQEEVRRDLNNGLFGKTAIHPTQIDTIEEVFQVERDELQQAEAILAPDAKAVFRMGGRMCEPTTHSRWAEDIVQRARIYGTRNGLHLVSQVG